MLSGCIARMAINNLLINSSPKAYQALASLRQHSCRYTSSNHTYSASREGYQNLSTIRQHRQSCCYSVPSTNGGPVEHIPANGWLLDDNNSSKQEYDAILMLGGGLWEDAKLPPWVVRRLHGALHLFNHQQKSGNKNCPIVLLGAGTPHKPAVVNSAGYVIHESTAYAAYLTNNYHVPASLILKESQSYDTVGNAYFSMVIHALPAGWKKLAIVTSDFHMPRTQAIFNTCYALAPPPVKMELSYHAVSDEGLFDEEVITAREGKESAAVERWHKDTSGFKTLADLHAWLFATHLCYSASRQHEFGVVEDLDPRLAATY